MPHIFLSIAEAMLHAMFATLHVVMLKERNVACRRLRGYGSELNCSLIKTLQLRQRNSTLCKPLPLPDHMCTLN